MASCCCCCSLPSCISRFGRRNRRPPPGSPDLLNPERTKRARRKRIKKERKTGKKEKGERNLPRGSIKHRPLWLGYPIGQIAYVPWLAVSCLVVTCSNTLPFYKGLSFSALRYTSASLSNKEDLFQL